jgi:hypothetical protein
MKTIALTIGPVILLPILQVTAPTGLRADETAVVPSAPARSLPAVLAAAAQRMIAEYPETRYSHQTHIDKQRGICEVDCSGFIVTLLKRTAPKRLESIRTTHKRPLAEDFYAAFAPKSGGPARGWKPIERLADARPGDVLAWVKAERMPGDNTGHVLLIAQNPVPETTERFRVRIFDSTLHGHAQDERTKTGRSGIGQGTLWLEADPRGRPVGYRWNSRTGTLHTAPIAIGRLMPSD